MKLFKKYIIFLFLQKNPIFEHIAVGANGKNPVINILDWPHMTTIIVLKGGTTKRYLHLSYRFIFNNNFK